MSFLDDVIKDYETYAALVKELKEENARLREELAKKTSQATRVHQFLSLLQSMSFLRSLLRQTLIF